MRTVWASDADEPGLNAALAGWVNGKLFGESGTGFGPCTTMGVFDGDHLLGVMVYHNYNSKAGVIEISGAAEHARWLTNAVLLEMFAYPFDQIGCQLVVMRVSEENRRLSRILTAYGFDRYKIPRLRGRHEDEIVFTLTDDRWRNNRFHRRVIDNGKELSRAHAA